MPWQPWPWPFLGFWTDQKQVIPWTKTGDIGAKNDRKWQKKTAISGKNLQETLDCRSATADHYWDTDLFSQLSGILFKRGVDMRYVDWTEERGEDKRRGWNERFYGNIKRFITKFNLLFISKNATVVGNCIPWSFWIIKSRDFHCERIAGLHCAADKCCILQQNCDQKNILRGWEKTGGEALEHSSSTLGITVTWYLITTTTNPSIITEPKL